MELVGSGFGDELQLRVRIAPILGAEIISDDFDFFDRAEVQIRNAIGSSTE